MSYDEEKAFHSSGPQFLPWRLDGLAGERGQKQVYVSWVLVLLHMNFTTFNIQLHLWISISSPLFINAKEAEVESLYEDLQDLLELTLKKDVLFLIGVWNTKVGSQKIPGVTGKFGLRVQNESDKKLTVLPRERTGHSKHPLPTTQETTVHMDITRWSTPKSDWLYSLQPKMEKLYIVSKNKTRSWLWLRS